MDLNIPFFVVNLERSHDRRKHMLKTLKKRGVNGVITQAVDGMTLNIEELKRRKIYDVDYALEKFNRELRPSEIGCALSHLNVYRKLVDENIKVSIICEDDVDLVANFKQKLAGVLGELPKDWELVYLWYRTRVTKRISDRVVCFPSQNHIPGGAVCYMIKKSGAEKLINEAFPIHYPSDSLIGRGYRWGVKTYGATPKLAKIDLLFPSTIRKTRMAKIILKNVLPRILLKR